MEHINVGGFHGQGRSHSHSQAALRPKRSIHDLYHEHMLPVSDAVHVNNSNAASTGSSKRHRCRGKALRKAAAAGGARHQGAVDPPRAVQSAPTSPEMEMVDDDSSMADFDCYKVGPPLCFRVCFREARRTDQSSPFYTPLTATLERTSIQDGLLCFVTSRL